MSENPKNLELSKVLDLEKIRVVGNPIEKAHGLPNECYTNSDYLTIERDRIFKDKWSVIGVGSSVPNVGDTQPYNLLGIPLIILRDKERKVRVFHNVCSHRGFKLLDKPCSLKNVLRCPYHSWSYDFNGKLVATPHIGGLNIHETEKFDKSSSNLKEVRTKVWMDIIFVNLNGDELEFDEYIKPLEERWSKFISKEDQKLLKHSKDHGYFSLDVKSNWKFAIENYCESYHLPWIHPELNKVSNISNHYHIQGLPNRFAGQGTNKYDQPVKGNQSFDNFPNWPKDLSKKAEYIALFPNVMIGLHIDHFYIFWLEPKSVSETKEHLMMYYVGDDSANGPEFTEMRKKNAEFWKEVMSEDIKAIEGMQEGRSSPVYNGGNFSPIMDNPTYEFHKWIATNLI
ncbi:aromatic ring-hydroxylating dioxygenase subunit alpha [Candidatus Pelagibacter sp.]|nr:aromatic ring-hydroxylating dioxygenase subunit alpha [Candidatus Pelagibacter sp.]MDA7732254.1 aromatic ring-hydroxylating dioxygenase subunit alpha [Candidatus Pelagibacter sp.]MDA9569107.1 aromatic ring-hydroxylating dioxygenase subunit alpha [Candidatus Pelagibacter sp.]MDC1483043.1 aromatic ring-hydroxylating dioxygenase subunit alpha [Pelagibacteraceae bacterium]